MVREFSSRGDEHFERHLKKSLRYDSDLQKFVESFPGSVTSSEFWEAAELVFAERGYSAVSRVKDVSSDELEVALNESVYSVPPLGGKENYAVGRWIRVFWVASVGPYGEMVTLRIVVDVEPEVIVAKSRTVHPRNHRAGHLVHVRGTHECLTCQHADEIADREAEKHGYDPKGESSRGPPSSYAIDYPDESYERKFWYYVRRD